MRYRIRRHTASAPSISPRPSHRSTASRHASRRTVSPDGSAQGTTQSYTLPFVARLACLPSRLSHRLISSPHLPVRCLSASSPHAVACRHSLHPSHPSHPLRPISSAHLSSHLASRCASCRASRFASSRLTACHAFSSLCSISSVHLPSRCLPILVHLIHLIDSSAHRLIARISSPRLIR